MIPAVLAQNQPDTQYAPRHATRRDLRHARAIPRRRSRDTAKLRSGRLRHRGGTLSKRTRANLTALNDLKYDADETKFAVRLRESFADKPPPIDDIGRVVRFLAAKGARMEVWNQPNAKGWTPLKIAEGVQRGMNIVSSPPTAATLREVIATAATVAPPR